jgi:hypothetical protein
MFFPLNDHNITCSHCERDSLALVLDFSSLGGVAQLLKVLFLGEVVLCAIGRFTTRDWIYVSS